MIFVVNHREKKVIQGSIQFRVKVVAAEGAQKTCPQFLRKTSVPPMMMTMTMTAKVRATTRGVLRPRRHGILQSRSPSQPKILRPELNHPARGRKVPKVPKVLAKSPSQKAECNHSLLEAYKTVCCSAKIFVHFSTFYCVEKKFTKKQFWIPSASRQSSTS